MEPPVVHPAKDAGGGRSLAFHQAGQARLERFVRAWITNHALRVESLGLVGNLVGKASLQRFQFGFGKDSRLDAEPLLVKGTQVGGTEPGVLTFHSYHSQRVARAHLTAREGFDPPLPGKHFLGRPGRGNHTRRAVDGHEDSVDSKFLEIRQLVDIFRAANGNLDLVGITTVPSLIVCVLAAT